MTRALCSLGLLGTWVLLGTARTDAQAGFVLAQQKISQSEGGFTGLLNDYDALGSAVASLGDVNDDGNVDVVIGAPGYGGVGSAGRVWVQFLSPGGTVAGGQEIAAGVGGFTGMLDAGDSFGASAAGIGDLNGDGVEDVVIGAPGDDDGGESRGAIWVLFLRVDGSVWGNWKISDLSGGFAGSLDDNDLFGSSVAVLGDLNSDGHVEVAVGAPFDDDGGSNRGAVWVLSLNANGTVWSHQKISVTSGGFTGQTHDNYRLGRSLARFDDLDGDGGADVAVGNYDEFRGGIHVLFLSQDGTVRGQRKIGSADLPIEDDFAAGLASIGDIDGDLVEDLAVGVPQPASSTGRVWVLFMNRDGSPRSYQPIGPGQGGFTGQLQFYEQFGSSVASLGDLDGDQIVDIAVGARGNDDGGFEHGAAWVLFLDCSSATATDRNGSGINPGILYSSTLPNVGSTWTVDLNCIGHAPAFSAVILRSLPASGTVIGPGEILIGGQRYLSVFQPHNGDVQQFALAIPDDNVLCGLRVYTQGICFGSPGAQLSNAVDIVVGH